MHQDIGTITVYSTRGGNGKTISSVMIAIAAAKRNLKTVIIDADLEAPSLLHLLKPNYIDLTWIDFLEEMEKDISKLPIKTSIPNLDVIYSPTPRVGKNFLGWKSKDWWQQALKRSIAGEQQLHEIGYDLVVVDNQSGTSLNSVNNMVLADTSVMIIRPATYGVGAAEHFIGEMYRVLRDIKPRKDYYMWNQVFIPEDSEDKNFLESFLSKWDENLKNHGLINGGRINFNTKLNLGLLGEEPQIEDFFSEVEVPINLLLDQILESNIS
ncbi:MAG: ParA family protein [Candidatus Heimdallarchaeota archaeon]